MATTPQHPTPADGNTGTQAPKRSRRRIDTVLNVVAVVATLVLLVGVILWRIPSTYQLVLPAAAEPVDAKIYVGNHPAPTGRGHFDMTFVEEEDSNLLYQIFGRFDPDAALEPLPPHYSASQNQQQNQALMLDSTETAELVALCHIGYKSLCAGGVQIVKIEPYSKASKALRVGDVITAVDGKQVVAPDQLRASLVSRPPGTVLTLLVRRGGKTITVRAPSVRSQTKPYSTVLGIEIQEAPPLSLPSRLPIDIKIDPGNIGGPSAGLMFTLGILNRLSPTDLTHGQVIAGTGTMSLDGSVGPIGGVKQKVIGAQWAHARYFFVPCAYGNYDDARKVVGKSMQLVPVSSLDDALNFLKTLQAPTSCPAQ